MSKQFALTPEDVRLPRADWTFFRPECVDDLLDEEAFRRDERIPYWAELWPAGRILAELLLENGPGRGQPLLELGCGLGLVACAGLLAGYDVLATDYYPDALDFTRANALHNRLPEPATRLVDWRQRPEDPAGWQRIVAADVLYERPQVPLVAGLLARLLTPDGCAWVADPSRSTAEGFAAQCALVGCAARIVHTACPRLGSVRPAVNVWEVRRTA